jgi:hypothetical protein
MNRTYINVALAIIVAVLLIALALIVRSPTPGNLPAVISVSTSTIATTAPTYSIAADYPVFGIPDLDSKIVDVVHVGVANIEGVAADPDGTKNQFTSSYDSVYTDASDASVRLILSEYTGGAHDISAAVGLTYDRQAGTFLTLDDALALTGDTLDQISAIAKMQLTKQFGSVAFPDGIAPTAENFATFTVSKSSVIFTIQEYQAEPYSDGMPEIVVPRVK